MAKLSMKNYEDFLQEEARQDRLQKELESKREFESLDSEEYWWDYQRKQEEDKRIDCYDDYDYDYFEDDYYEDDEDDGYGPEYDPCGPDGSLTADDLYDMYGYSAEYD